MIRLTTDGTRIEHGMSTERANQIRNRANDIRREKSVFNPYYDCKYARLLDKVCEAALFSSSPHDEGERENRPSRLRQSRALRLVAARDAVFPLPAGEGQGEGKAGLQLSGTWRFARRGVLFSFPQRSGLPRRFAGALVCAAFLPPHPSLLPEERESRTLRLRQSRTLRLVAARDAVFPLPAGDSGSAQRQGEGERDAANRNGRTDFVGSTRPARRVRVGYHFERRACRWWKRARSQAHRCFERCFPLTPALSLGERVDTGLAPEKFQHRLHSLSCGWGRDRSHPVCPAITADRRVRGTPVLTPALCLGEGVVAPEPRRVSSVAEQLLNL